MYKDNKVAQKVGQIFAEDGVKWVENLCSPTNTRNSNTVVKRGMSAAMASRESKNHRDVLVENLMKAISEPKKFKLENFVWYVNIYIFKTSELNLGLKIWKFLKILLILNHLFIYLNYKLS